MNNKEEQELIDNLKKFVKINEIVIAKSFLQQTLGLMFKKTFPYDCGMWFEMDKQKTVVIHSYFMRFSLNIYFFNEKYELIKIIKNMKPWKHIRVEGVKAFLEMRSNYI